MSNTIIILNSSPSSNSSSIDTPGSHLEHGREMSSVTYQYKYYIPCQKNRAPVSNSMDITRSISALNGSAAHRVLAEQVFRWLHENGLHPFNIAPQIEFDSASNCCIVFYPRDGSYLSREYT